MKVYPSTRQLYGLRDSRIGHAAAAAELIDNALDAGADEVKLEWRRGKIFTITDNGDGVPVDDMGRLFALGLHTPNGRRRRTSGEYGLGFKWAIGWHWGRTRVVSAHGGRVAHVIVDLEDWAESDRWDLPDPEIGVGDAGSHGLMVECQGIRETPTREDYQKLIADLEFKFAPALRSGKRIESTWREQRKIWTATAPPDRTDVIEQDLEVAGKRVHLNVGIVKEGVPNLKSGLHYYRVHRLVMPGSSFGCGTTNTARLFGWIELDKAWRLTPLKDGLTDPATPALQAAIEACLAPVLAKAGKQADVLAVQGLETELSLLLTERLSALERDEREKRQPPMNQTGRREPTGTGGRRNRASQRQPGETLLRQVKHGGIRVHIKEMDHPGVGKVERDPLVIHINKCHPNVARTIRLRPNEALGGAYRIAVELLAFEAAMDDQADRQGQLKMEFIRKLTGPSADRFSVALGYFMSILQDE
jgi:Histidine kinase-, DNA gyrase B-, and HSP90-like ATPase